MDLHLTNTLTRRKERFVPRDAGRVGMYLCGPTVYSEPHIGNLRPEVVFDVLRRHLAAEGYETLLVRNYTDVDDKIIAASGHDPLRGAVLAERWTRVYEEITGTVGVRPPDIAPRATGHIPEMHELVKKLIDADLAYTAGGDVYLSVGNLAGYGRLSHQDVGDLRAGASERVDLDTAKRDPLDFAVWKGAKPGEPTWDSPWGKGRPGWHLECSAMAGKYLGAGFDIHGGGEDLIFPHHENEIAQWEGATGQPFARFWLHNAFLTIKGEKMAKSVGNVVSPRELLKRYRGPVVRYALLGAHYRGPLEFSFEALDDAAASYDRLATFAVNAARALPVPAGEPAAAPGTPGEAAARAAGGPKAPGAAEDGFARRFVAALDDDLNVPAALAVLFELVAEANPLIAKAERGDAAAAGGLRGHLATFTALTARLGLHPLEELPRADVMPHLLDLILELRQRARSARDFAAADLIRQRLAELGVRVEDRAGGSRWHLGN